MQKFKGELLLFIASVIWGSSFVFQKMGMDFIGPLTFTALRFGIGAICMLPVVLFTDYRFANAECEQQYDIEKNKKRGIRDVFSDRMLLIGGILVGVSNMFASLFQQYGIVYTTAGKAGFLTALDMVIVPFFLVMLRRKVHPLTWLGVAVAVVGVYFLCINESFSLQSGDILCIIGAAGYAVQILLIDYYVDRVDPIKLAFLEFAVTAVIVTVLATVFENPDFEAMIDCAVPVLYTAVLEVCVAFSFQMIGQKYAPPAIATIIMSFESVFAVIAGTVILGEVMTHRELMGCIIMFIAFIIAQIPEMSREDTDI